MATLTFYIILYYFFKIVFALKFAALSVLLHTAVQFEIVVVRILIWDKNTLICILKFQ